MDQLNYKEQQQFSKVVEDKQMSDFMRVSKTDPYFSPFHYY